MRRKKKDLDKLVDFVVDGAVDEFIEEMAAEEGIAPEDLASAYMEIMQAFMTAGFTRDEAFELLLNSI